MNMISQLRQRVVKDGKTEITVEEFNQLQAEWITRTKMEKDELTASPVERLVIKQTFKEEKERFLKEVQHLCAIGRNQLGAVVEERLIGIRAIESKLIEKGIAL